MIAINHVTMRYPVPKRYRDYLFHPFRRGKSIVALKNVSLHVPEGYCIGLLGPNGAGKTTLLKIIGGLIYPSEGQVIVNGFDTIGENLHVRASVGYIVGEDRSFYWRLTGAQNLEFFGALDDLYGKSLQGRILAVLELVGLDQDQDKQVSDYSTGMRKRLAIARGLLSNPDVLLLDEPTNSLDPLAAAKFRKLIGEDIHKSRKRTLVIATHNLEEAQELCDLVYVINHGNIVARAKTGRQEQSAGDLAGLYSRAMQGDCKETDEDRNQV